MLQKYMKELSRTRLTAQQEIELATAAQSGNVAARNKLVEANLAFALSVAKKFNNKNLPLEDLVSAANMGLIKASEKYDPTVGVKFITFAVHWIKAAIMEELHNRFLVKTPLSRENVYTTSIDQAVPGTDDMYLYETIAYDGERANTDIEARDFKTHLREVLETYPQRTRDILDGYFQLYNEYASIEDVASKYNVSVERLRFIKEGVLKELKATLQY
jgi:RNA polymerase sigma factor (sigma-70 family)